MPAGSADPPPHRLVEADYDALDGFPADDHLAFWDVFAGSVDALVDGMASLRNALTPSERTRQAMVAATAGQRPQTGAVAADRIRSVLRPYRIEAGGDGSGFLTGYYEPWVHGSLERTPQFTAPILPRPSGIDQSGPGAAERSGRGRREIEAEAEAGRHPAVVWLRDWVEVFLIQVQGSARVTLPGGRTLRLIYDGRNGRPYTSIGRILIESGEIAAAEMSLGRLKAWIRRNGQADGEPGRALMWRNDSYVFFRAEADDGGGPIGGQGLRLEPLRSIAVDRTLWPYGLAYWIEADLPWRSDRTEPFRRLMVGQDTGSAIVGPARADLFFGTGDAAGERAGAIRHPCRMWVLLPAGCDLPLDAADP